MKKVLLLFLLAPFALFSQSYDALFLGNSYTFCNNVIRFSLHNLQGQLVFSKDIVGLERINFSHLPKGYYIANLVVQEEVRTFKLFKNDR